MLTEPPNRFRFGLSWSRWRRRHQAIAKRCHAARRALRQISYLDGADVVSKDSIDHIESTESLGDEEWARIEPLLRKRSRPGRPSTKDQRQVIRAILWVQRGGRAWRELPSSLGSWLNVYAQYQRWRQSGVWLLITQELTQTKAAQVSL